MQWKIIADRPGYSVSENGDIRNNKTGRILKGNVDNNGYIRVMLGRKTSPLYIHRIVAMAFIDNPESLPQVDHIDGDKSNNAVSNLRWVSASANCWGSGYADRIVNRWKPVRATNTLTGEVKTFLSRDTTAAFFKCHKSQIKYDVVYKKGNKKGWILTQVEDIV